MQQPFPDKSLPACSPANITELAQNEPLHCLRLFQVTDEKNILQDKIIELTQGGHGAICEILKDNNIEVLICGGLGSGAKDLLKENDIKFYAGVSGNADEKVIEFINDELVYNNTVKCTNHNNKNHNCEEHDCKTEKHGCNGNK